MKGLYSILVVTALLFAHAQCQDENSRGLLNLVNLIPGDTPCDVTLNGKEMLPDGMKAGAETGWFSLPAGRLEISVKSGDCQPASGNMELDAGIGIVIAIYLEPNLKRDADGKPLPPKVRLKRFPTYPAGVYGMQIVSLCPEGRVFGFGPAKMVVKPFTPIDMKTWRGAGFNVTSRGKVIGKVENSPQKANYYVFVAPGNDGDFFAANANADQLSSRR